MAHHIPSSALPDSGSRVHGRSLATELLLALRPGQWTKNLLVFAGLIFGQKLLIPADVATAAAAFGLFCLFSGVVYLVNDIQDRDADRLHPKKSKRPIASGSVSVGAASALAVVLAAVSLGAAYALDRQFFFVGLSYVGLLTIYSVWLKHSPVLDVLVLTLLSALFLATGKRRAEYVALAGSAAAHRPSLEHYSVAMLDQMLSVLMACTLLGYAFYTISPETVTKFGTSNLVMTFPLPIYGLFRYLYLIHRGDAGGNPSDLLLSDRPLQLAVVIWGALVAAIIYGPLK